MVLLFSLQHLSLSELNSFIQYTSIYYNVNSLRTEIFFFLNYFIVVQLHLSAFSPLRAEILSGLFTIVTLLLIAALGTW